MVPGISECPLPILLTLHHRTSMNLFGVDTMSSFVEHPSQASNPMMSMRGTMAVHNFDPMEGPSTTVLTVRLNFRSPFPDIDGSQYLLRICIDHTPLPTKMIQRGGTVWELRALIPEQGTGKGSLKLSIQAFYNQEIIDVVEFGFYNIFGNTEGEITLASLWLVALISSIPQTRCSLENEVMRTMESRYMEALHLSLTLALRRSHPSRAALLLRRVFLILPNERR